MTEPTASWVHGYCPGWLLHEVAHALEDRLTGLECATAKATYRQAMDRKLYDDVKVRTYNTLTQLVTGRGPAYARTNHMEYFAELSATYLGLPAGFFPFTRAELEAHDPAGYALMEKFCRSIPSTVVN